MPVGSHIVHTCRSAMSMACSSTTAMTLASTSAGSGTERCCAATAAATMMRSRTTGVVLRGEKVQEEWLPWDVRITSHGWTVYRNSQPGHTMPPPPLHIIIMHLTRQLRQLRLHRRKSRSVSGPEADSGGSETDTRNCPKRPICLLVLDRIPKCVTT